MNQTNFSRAFSQRWTSLRRKLPIIIAAAFACYGLYYLDVVKRRFDEEKNTPVLIDRHLKARLLRVVSNKEGDATADDLQNFIVEDQYTAQSDFINKIAARISAEAQANEFVAQETFKKCVAQALDRPSTDPQNCTEAYLKKNREDYVQAEQRIATIYTHFKTLNLKDEGKKAREAARIAVEPPRAKSYVESSLQPILNEQGGVHIVYQILRIALIVVIAFALVSVVVLLLTTVMLSDGVKVLTEQAVSFIGRGGGSIGSAAKVGALSVAALGLGGAFVAGAATNPTAGEPLAYLREGSTLKSPNPAPGGRSKDPARPNVTHHDGSNIQYDYGDSGNIYDYSQKNDLVGDNPQPPVKIFPEFLVPRPEPIETSVYLDRSVTDAFKSSLESLEKLNQILSNQVQAVATAQTREDIKVSNLLKNPVEKDPLLIVEAPKGPISSSLDKVETGLGPIKDVATNLADLQVTNPDRPAQPQERSFLSRLIRGSDKYFFSRLSFEQLENLRDGRRELYTREINKLKPETSADEIAHLNWKIEADNLILRAIEELYLDAYKPTDKETLYTRLEGRLRGLLSQSTMLPERRDNTVERLKYWREPILIYTRIN